MKNSLLIMLATSSAALLMGLSTESAMALPGAGLNAGTSEETVTIRINEETGVAEMEENGTWTKLQAVELPANASVQKTQYYGYDYYRPYNNPCATTVYSEPCAPPPCVTCAPLPPPLPQPCATNCGVYAVPGYNYGYARPYYEAPPVAPPVVYPRRYYRRGPSIYYQYPRYPRRYY